MRNFVDGGDLTPETEVVSYFLRPGGGVDRPSVNREATFKDSRKRNAVSMQVMEDRKAAWSAEPLAPGTKIAFKTANGWVLKEPNRSTSRLELAELGKTWRFDNPQP